MLTINPTPNLTGVTISGDVDDLRQLVDAFHFVVADESDKDFEQYETMSIRVLGVCYDVRHASMGDREAFVQENGMNRDLMKFHKLVSGETNVYFRCRVLMPEMMYVMLALNKLVERRVLQLMKRRTGFPDFLHMSSVWDETIVVIRLFQSQFSKCVQTILTQQRYSRWLKTMNGRTVFMSNMIRQFLDVLNIDWIDCNREKRLQQFTKLAERLADYYGDEEYREIKQVVLEGAKQFGAHPSDIELAGNDYPEEDEIEW